MAVISWIVIGLIAGWLAAQIMGGRGGLMNNLAVGLLGGIVGGFLFTYIGQAERPSFFGSLFTATVGAILLLLVWRLIRRA